MFKLNNLHKLFYTPIWKYEYVDFKKDEDFLLEYFTRDEHYIAEKEQNGLQITRANLHKDPALNKLTDFIIACAEDAMNQMGYEPHCGITSLWATRQRQGGFHHRHHHVNSFLGGVFHLYDHDSCASGTVFYNTDSSKYVIQPAIQTDKDQMFSYREVMEFDPGHFFLFPAWAQHDTMPSQSQYRIVAATNIMPIGKTNKDHFDRYNYPDPSGMVLKEYQG
jgi:hypothetical protein